MEQRTSKLQTLEIQLAANNNAVTVLQTSHWMRG